MNAKHAALVFSMLSFFFITACNNSSADQKGDGEKVEAPKVERMDNKVYGAYYGVLPCASCGGIHTYVTLLNDGTFEKTVQYEGKEEKPENAKGKFKWSSKDKTVELDGDRYLIGDGEITMLDAQGKKAEGELADKYILRKMKAGNAE